MKIIIFMFIVSVIFAGCADTYDERLDVQYNKNLLYESEYEKTYAYEEPFEIKYGSGQIKIKEIKVYQEKSDHGYYAYPLLIFDISSLSEDDVYWLNKEMEISMLFTNDKNCIDSEHRKPVCYHADAKNNYVVFDVSKEQKYSFDKSKVSMFIEIISDSSSDIYMFTVEAAAISTEEMDSDLYNAIIDAYNNKLENLKTYLY